MYDSHFILVFVIKAQHKQTSFILYVNNYVII